MYDYFTGLDFRSCVTNRQVPQTNVLSLCVLDMAGLGRANWLKNCSDLLEQVVQW